MKLLRLFLRTATPIAAVLLMLAGIMQLRAQFWMAGATCIALAMAGLIFSMRSLERSPFTPEEVESLRPYAIPVLGWLVVLILLMISVINVVDHYKNPGTDRLASATWISSLILGLIIVWWGKIGQRDTSSLKDKIKANRAELTALLIVLVTGLGLRIISLSTHPYPWSGDEASVGSEALRILSGETTNFFDTGWSSQPNWSFLPAAITQYIFGANIFAIRLVSALIGTAAILLVYLAGREMFNPTVGLTAGAFLATLPYHVHFSRVGVSNITDSLMSSLMFWLLAKGLRKDDRHYYYAAGVVAGLSLYTYSGTRLILLLAGATLLFLILRQRVYLASHWQHLLAFLAGALVSAAPQAGFFAQHRDIFMGRLGQEAIFLNGWIAQEAAKTGQSTLGILYEQFSRTTGVFIASPAIGNFFGSPDPYLTVLASILFLIGMGYALAYLPDLRYFILLLWFWAVILLGGVLTTNPPANTRLLMTTPAVALFMALGTHKILEYLQSLRIVSQRASTLLLILSVAIIAFQNVNFYMFEYRTNMYFQDANGEFAMEAGKMAQKMGGDYQIYVLGGPRVYSGFPTLPFLAPKNPRYDLGAGNIETLKLPVPPKAVFFATPENRPLLAEIVQKYPGGEGGLVYRNPKPAEILFEYYILGHQDD